MAMPRFRRYRVFVFGAAFFIFIIYRLSGAQISAQDGAIYRGYQAGADEGDIAETGGSNPVVVVDENADSVPAVEATKEQSAHLPELHTSLEVKGSYSLPTSQHSPKPAVPQQTQQPEAAGSASGSDAEQPAAAAQQTPAPVAPADADAIDTANATPTYSTSTIHWMKMAEHFPIPEESLIILPTGKPKNIPRIQHKFKGESNEARETRESRLASVRSEMEHAWTGYRTYAWTHDELSPVSKSFRDPFCGWAASLVDALDTLWIMELYEEFDHAYEAVKDIDFTTTPYRAEIPVFETIIRYLGGLIAAYDLTGGPSGKYPMLLTKAVELAEILMGVFDTPNRMPILYYNWKPAFYSQPKAASSSVSVAELGSMTMEFTRLAQITGHTKYYDAIARIVDALEEWQNRENGTALPGIFPESVDASGCNRTAAAIMEAAAASKLAQTQITSANDTEADPVGYQPTQPDADPMASVDKVEIAKTMKPDLEFKVNPATSPDTPATGEFRKVDKREVPAEVANAPAEAEASTEATVPASETVESDAAERQVANGDPAPVQADGQSAEFQCIPMNLTSGGYGMDSFSMGGSQDSTYEYFPKQYLLLGGLVPKYQTMHEKVADAVKKYLLYRPMIKDDRDILFSAKVSSRDGSDTDLVYHYEVSHLTCFLGGMFAMGGRIFDRPEDVEIGAKLADGCAWAYEAMPMGVMPEWSTIMACPNTTSPCEWNETAWRDRLDPNAEWRTDQLREYEVHMEEWREKAEEVRKQQKERAAQKEREGAAATGAATGSVAPASSVAAAAAAAATVAAEPAPAAAAAAIPAAIEKRDVVADGEAVPASDTLAIDRKVEALENEMDLNKASSGGAESAAAAADGTSSELLTADADNQKPLQPVIPPMPIRPETHEEFIEHRIEHEKLVPGFEQLSDRRYILRPEAIESVWYMYRITGDAVWQERGWRMFQAVIKATRTEAGHSAIPDVTADPSAEPNPLDNMESFWFAETLKYFYLLFTKPDVVSLDDYVFNTEAHPFKRPT